MSKINLLQMYDGLDVNEICGMQQLLLTANELQKLLSQRLRHCSTSAVSCDGESVSDSTTSTWQKIRPIQCLGFLLSRTLQRII
jgi:hypothetical protein